MPWPVPERSLTWQLLGEEIIEKITQCVKLWVEVSNNKSHFF